MFKKQMIVQEGDIGVLFDERIVEQNEQNEQFEYCVSEGWVEYKSKEECLSEFEEMVQTSHQNNNADERYVQLVRKYVELLKEKSKEIEGKWFVGENGEYVVMVGFDFESDDGSVLELDNQVI